MTLKTQVVQVADDGRDKGIPTGNWRWRGKYKTCTVCGDVIECRGLCNKHYLRWKKFGDPEMGKSKTPTLELKRFYDKALLHDGDACLIWPFGRFSNGYANWGGRLVSRLICRDIHGPPPTSKYHAAHSCGKAHLGCINPRHLAWKTALENNHDKVAHGTINKVGRGERSGQSKLTEKDVLAIRSLKGKMSHKEIAAKFGICTVYVSDLQRRKWWGWLC